MNGFVVFSLTILAVSNAAQVPSYFQKCSKNEQVTLNKCMVEQANSGWPTLNKGDKSVHMPPTNPLDINQMLIDVDGNLKIDIRDCKMYGLEDIHFEKLDLDLKDQKIDVIFTVPKVSLIGTYDIKGRILLLPISGNGPTNITFVGGKYYYKADYNLKEKNNKHYVDIQKQTLNYDLDRAYFKLDNLFNGDKLLGEEMNKVLDENWKDVNNEIGVKVGDALGEIGTSLISGFFGQISFEDLYTD